MIKLTKNMDLSLLKVSINQIFLHYKFGLLSKYIFHVT